MARDLPSGSPEQDWLPPVEFDGFRVIRLLGRGGMGEVYLGHDATLNRPVALKFIATTDPTLAVHERFVIEARAIARLAHPNVVGIFRVGEVLGRPYIAYEFIPGTSLDRLAKPIAWQKALEIGLGIARGLAAAHRRGVLHRDIKPANVILAETGEVKLLDFGIAKLLDGWTKPAESAAPSFGALTFRPHLSGEGSAGVTVQTRPDPETIALGTGAVTSVFTEAATAVFDSQRAPQVFLDTQTIARPPPSGAPADSSPAGAGPSLFAEDAGDVAGEAAARPAIEAVLLEPTRLISRGAGDPPASSPRGPDSQLTAIGALLGTPIYMAPELWRGEPASVQSDIYALGLVLFELVTGHVPHEQLRGAELAEVVLRLRVPALKQMCPGVPQSFADIVDRCLCRRRDDRYPSVSEVLDALEIVRTVYQPFAAAEALSTPVNEVPIRVAASFARVAPHADAFSQRLYATLFERYPAVQSLFPDDITGLRRKLIGALQVAVENLHKPERLVPVIEELGRKHAAFGVEPAHFDAVGEALMATLAEFDCEHWSEEIEGAWAGAYTILAEAMQRGIELEQTTSARVTMTSPQEREPPRTRYAQRGDLNLAYQVVGERPVDLLLAQSWVTHLEVGWQCPQLARFLRRLSRSVRLIAFDKRGTGMSDRVAAGVLPEERASDLLAVLDAAGSGRAVLFGAGDAAADCALFAALHPARTRGLILFGGSARATTAPDYPHGADPSTLEPLVRQVRARWGEPVFVEEHAPSVAADEAFLRWWAAYLRMASGPGAAIELLRASAAVDVRHALGGIRAPTLVLHRAGDAATPLAAGRDLAARIPGARFVELPGADHLPFVGDADALFSEVRRFLAELSPDPAA